jgi:hypothetical protein
MYKMHHPKADIDRIYIKRKEGGRSLLQIAVAYKEQEINIAEYLNTKYAEYQFVSIVKSQESNQPNINSTNKTVTKVTEKN